MLHDKGIREKRNKDVLMCACVYVYIYVKSYDKIGTHIVIHSSITGYMAITGICNYFLLLSVCPFCIPFTFIKSLEWSYFKWGRDLNFLAERFGSFVVLAG